MLRYLNSLDGVKSLISISGMRQMIVNRKTASNGCLVRKLFFIGFLFFESYYKVPDIGNETE